MTRLLNAAWAMFGPPNIFKWEGLIIVVFTLINSQVCVVHTVRHDPWGLRRCDSLWQGRVGGQNWSNIAWRTLCTTPAWSLISTSCLIRRAVLQNRFAMAVSEFEPAALTNISRQQKCPLSSVPTSPGLGEHTTLWPTWIIINQQ